MSGAFEPVGWRCKTPHGYVIGKTKHASADEAVYSQEAIDTLRAQLEATQGANETASQWAAEVVAAYEAKEAELINLRAANIAYSQQVNELIGRAGNAEARAEAAEAECARLRVDSERYEWLKQHDVGIGNEGFGDWAHYAYADAEPNHGRLGLDATIDAART